MHAQCIDRISGFFFIFGTSLFFLTAGSFYLEGWIRIRVINFTFCLQNIKENEVNSWTVLVMASLQDNSGTSIRFACPRVADPGLVFTVGSDFFFSKVGSATMPWFRRKNHKVVIRSSPDPDFREADQDNSSRLRNPAFPIANYYFIREFYLSLFFLFV